MNAAARLARGALFRLEPERAHALALRALETGLVRGNAPAPDPRLRATVAGLTVPNPLGVAAGFDKDGRVPDAMLRLGFGFTEVGTVTPRAQIGNPRPRVFRLTAERAVVNRLGFNNEGHGPCAARLAARRARGGIVGVNIGANKDSADRLEDYALGVRRFAALASYLTVNVSSPNTPGLRDLQARDALRELLARVMAARDEGTARPPVFLKIAPDLSENGLSDVADAAAQARLDGVIVSNTTLSRPLAPGTRHGSEAGGLSGRPLFARATAALARLRAMMGPDAVLIGVGGVEDGASALEKVRAGADLVQLYTGFVYGGAGLAGRILRGMSAELDRTGATSLRALRDSRAAHWAGQPL